MPDLYPEMLAGAALAARFVSEPYIWDQFVEWCLDEGCLLPGEEMDRLLMEKASRAMWQTGEEIGRCLRAGVSPQGNDGGS